VQRRLGGANGGLRPRSRRRRRPFSAKSPEKLLQLKLTRHSRELGTWRRGTRSSCLSCERCITASPQVRALSFHAKSRDSPGCVGCHFQTSFPQEDGEDRVRCCLGGNWRVSLLPRLRDDLDRRHQDAFAACPPVVRFWELKGCAHQRPPPRRSYAARVLRKLVRLVNEQEPILIAFTGDFVTLTLGRFAAELRSTLNQLTARDGWLPYWAITITSPARTWQAR
jgi:hypothetical protein